MVNLLPIFSGMAITYTDIIVREKIPESNNSQGFSGQGGIRTLGTLLTYTRFPIVLFRPLRHLPISGKNPW